MSPKVYSEPFFCELELVFSYNSYGAVTICVIPQLKRKKPKKVLLKCLLLFFRNKWFLKA